MAADTKKPITRLRKLHASVLKWRRQSVTGDTNDYLLNDEDFRFAADCERMRVDRNNSVLSLLLVRLNQPGPEEIAFFARVLEGRLRVTDTPGLLQDGRVAVLLPDTPTAGAWKVAADVSEVYPPGPGRPECEVLVYPNGERTRSIDSQQEDSGEENDLAAPTNEFFFMKPQSVMKRLLDITGGLVGLLLSFPLLLFATVAVKATSRGPAFFSQQREGHGGKRFTMWKLRTMQVDAEAKKQDLRQYSQQDGPAFKMKRDPRTTRVGRFLRWTSMDELPQFWNVLRGDMSLVGPRPLPTEESTACEGWQRRRLSVKPGMTCTWQVCERGNVSFDQWVRMDLRYARRPSFWEDMRLLLLTLPSLILHKGMR